MEHLQTMFGQLPNMISGIVDFVQWCMSISVKDVFIGVSALVTSINPALGILHGAILVNMDEAVYDLPLFVFLFGGGFILYCTGSLVRWILDLFS